MKLFISLVHMHLVFPNNGTIRDIYEPKEVNIIDRYM